MFVELSDTLLYVLFYIDCIPFVWKGAALGSSQVKDMVFYVMNS